MKKINAEIIADSVNEQGDRITTFILTFPRFILAELNTHRMFSRNSASSRAIPFERMLKLVEEDPFIPIAWQKDHKGMQGTEYFSGWRTKILTMVWLRAAKAAAILAKKLNKLGLTKQLCNRLLEPFMWHTCLLTATEFENFFEQRCPYYEVGWYPESRSPEALEPTMSCFRSRKDALKYTEGTCDNWPEKWWRDSSGGQAEIHMQALAEAMWDQFQLSVPKFLKPVEWHIPFGDKIDEFQFDASKYLLVADEALQHWKVKIATARCARISYMTFDGEIDYKKDIKLHNDLLEDGHMSPFEHCARAMTIAEYGTFIKGKLSMSELLMEVNKEHAGWCNNFKGFVPYRYIIDNKYN